MAVIYDDMDLPVGKIRFRKKGGSGGHNGMKSIIQHLKTQEFNRVRVGVGRPFSGQSVISHVLSRFTKDEVTDLQYAINAISAAVRYWLNDRTFLEVMNEFN